MNVPELTPELDRPSRGRVGMLALIAAEAAIFTIFVVAYLFYIGKSLTRPMPKDVLSVPIFYTICLLSSSLTIHMAVRSLRRGSVRGFGAWWFGTIALGAAFMYGTAVEWYRLIYYDGLTISTNLFGTTYYSLVGLHGFHVVVGLEPLDSHGLRALGKSGIGTRGTCRRGVFLLALRGCRMDCGFFSRVLDWTIRGLRWDREHSTNPLGH